MSEELEKKWREEFEVEWENIERKWSFPLGSHHKKLVKETALNVYLAGRKAGQEEIDNLRKEHSQIVCAYCNSLCARNTEELVKHVEGCEKHPLGKAIKEIQKRDELLEQAKILLTLNIHKLSQEEWLKQYEELKR